MSNITHKTIEDWGLQRDTRAVGQLISTLQNNADLRWDAAWALGQIADRSAVPELINVLRNNDPNVRKRVAYSLGEIGDDSAIEPLQQLLDDADQYVRSAAEWALQSISETPEAVTEMPRQQARETMPKPKPQPKPEAVVEMPRQQTRETMPKPKPQPKPQPSEYEIAKVIVFGNRVPEEIKEKNLLKNRDLTSVHESMPRLEQIIVYTETAKNELLNSFFTYAEKNLKKKVPVVIYGNPQKLEEETYKKFKQYCQWDYDPTEVILFGKGDTEIPDTKITLWNPDLQNIDSLMPRLEKVIIWQQDNVFHLVEHFITAISNKLAQRNEDDKQVEVSWLGDSNDKFENFRREVKKDDHLKSV